MPNTLLWADATADDLPLLQSLRFGNQLYELEISDWLSQDAGKFLGQNGNFIWAYFNRSGDCVGFTSLSTALWNLTGSGGCSALVDIMYIPALGIDKRFHSVGSGEIPFPDRYLGQMLNHVIQEATKRKRTRDKLGLLTHPDNGKAADIYQSKCGFEKLPLYYFVDSNPETPYFQWIRKI